MEQYVYIDQFLVSDAYLQLNIKGKLENCNRRDKLRLQLYFWNEADNRRFPVELSYQFQDMSSLQCEFEGNILVDLPYVFFQNKNFTTCKMYINLEYGLEEMDMIPFDIGNLPLDEGIQIMPNHLIFDKKVFERKEYKKKGILYRIYQVLSFLGCTLLLPLFFVVAAFEKKDDEMVCSKQSRKTKVIQILRRINARTKKVSGLSYSKREFKTHFFILCYKLLKKKPIGNNRVAFLSERKPDANGNLIRIKEALETYPDVEVILYQNEKTVSNLGFLELYKIAGYIATAKIVVLDDFYPQIHAITVKKETTIIQLWHACGAFKTFGFTRLEKPGGVKQRSLNHRSYHYAFVSGKRICGIYSEAFGIPIENIKPYGLARTDVLFDKEYTESVKNKLLQRYPQLQNKKVVLLAPTFRGNGNRDAFYPIDKLIMNQFCESLPEEYVFIVKHHPFVKVKFAFDEKYQNRILDLSATEDINDVLLVTDVLVTDYSSVVFEAALLDIPMIFYAYDLDEYMKNRDIYYDYKNFVPGPIVFQQDELIKEILVAKKNGERNQLFREYFLDGLDGKSTNRITSFIYERCFSTKSK